MTPVLVHRPAPRGVVIVVMVLLALIVAPAFVLQDPRDDLAKYLTGLAVFGLFELGLFVLLLQRLVFTVDGGTLVLASSRFPLPSRERRVELARIARVELEHSGRRGGARLVLKLTDDTAVPLTLSFYGRHAQQDRDLEALRAVIASRR